MKTVSRYLLIVVTAFIALALSPQVWAVDPDYGYYTEHYLTASSKDCQVIFNAPSTTTTKQIILKSVDVTGDNADAVLYLYGGTHYTTINATLATTVTNVTVAATNTFAVDDFVVIQRSDGTSTWHFIAAISTGTLVVIPAVTTACASGDKMYRMSNVGYTTVGSATLRLQGDLFAAQVRMPLVVRMLSTAGTSEYIKSATVLYSDQFMN